MGTLAYSELENTVLHFDEKDNTWNDPGDGKPIEKALLESGCDPSSPNCLKLAYSDIQKAKERLMEIQ